jgi:hypothetical protein
LRNVGDPEISQGPMTPGNFRDSSPRWSPDGTRIA